MSAADDIEFVHPTGYGVPKIRRYRHGWIPLSPLEAARAEHARRAVNAARKAGAHTDIALNAAAALTALTAPGT